MGMSSLHSDNPVLQSRRKRSFSLPSFRKSSGERPVKTNAEETARVRKAAAWQWYIRGVGEVVAPTKPARPVAAANSPAVHVDDKCGVDGAKLMINDNNKQGQAQMAGLPINQPPQLQRAASRFKTEATTARPTASALHGAAPSPLYDECELSGLRTQMADFVQRLQQKQQKAGQEESLQAAHSYGDQESNKPQPPAGISTAASGGAIPAAASTHAFDRPLNAFHRFLRKVISGAALITKKSPTMQITTPLPAVQEPFAPLDEEEDTQYHYHHYIHHHHHHYHYGHSPEESAAITRRRRHSESSGMRPEIRLGPWEEVEEDSGGEEEDESPIQAYLARRRRYSDSFAGHYKAVIRGDAEEDQSRGPCMQQAGALRPELLQRRYNSERFMSTSPNKIPVVDGRVSGKCKLGSKDEIDGERMQNITSDIRSRRRHSADINVTEGASFNKKSVEVCRGGKTAGSTIYKLGGAHVGSEGAARPMAEVPRRRHSETYSASFRRSEMNDHMRMSAVGRTSSPAGGSDTMMYVPASGRQYFEKPLQFPAHPRTHATRDAALPPLDYPQ